MIVYGVTLRELAEAVDLVSREAYAGNVIYNRSPERSGRGYRFTLRVADSSGPGAKRGQSGRRTVSACWHVHYAIMFAIFRLCPEARIKSAIADYKGRVEFYRKANNTGDRNIGSLWNPQHYRFACEC